MKLKSLPICILIFFISGFPIFAHSDDLKIKNCKTLNDYSPKVAIVGDSFFTTEKSKLGSLESYLLKFIKGACVENLAKGGARFSGYGKNRIQKQISNSTPDLLVIGGGGNDFIKCGSDTSCMRKTLNKILSTDLQRGSLLEAIALNSDSNTKIIVLYPLNVTPHAPSAWKYVVKNIGQKYGSRMVKLAEKNPRIFWLDATLLIKTNVASHWLPDGYHPSVIANKRLAQAIEKIYTGAIEDTPVDYIDLQYDTKSSCSFSVYKSGYDDKESPYEYMQVEGELDVEYNLTFEEHIINFTRETWKISDASPTYLRDNMNGVLSLDANGYLHGILSTYSNYEASGTVIVSTDHYVFESSNNPQHLLEGNHLFQNPKNDESYRLSIFGCDDQKTS